MDIIIKVFRPPRNRQVLFEAGEIAGLFIYRGKIRPDRTEKAHTNTNPPAIQRDRGVTAEWVLPNCFTFTFYGMFASLKSENWVKILALQLPWNLLEHFGFPSSTILRFRWVCRCLASHL